MRYFTQPCDRLLLVYKYQSVQLSEYCISRSADRKFGERGGTAPALVGQTTFDPAEHLAASLEWLWCSCCFLCTSSCVADK